MPTLFDPVQFAHIIEPRLADHGVPGCVVAISTHDEGLMSAAYGWANPDRTAPLDDAAPVIAYSYSKVPLAAMALKLVERDHFGLDAAVVDLLPDVDVDRRITLRHLLSHRSGLPDYGALAAYREGVNTSPEHPWSRQTFVDHTLEQGMRFDPGDGFAYSNLGYMLVRRIIEEATGSGVGAAMQDLLGVHETHKYRWLDNPADASSLAPGFSTQIGDGTLRDVRSTYHPGWVAHGVLAASPLALALDLSAILLTDVLSPGNRALMLEGIPVPGTHSPFHAPQYGLGLMVDHRRDGGVVAGHGGSGPGFEVAVFSWLNGAANGVTVAVALNRDGANIANDIAFEIGEMIA